MNIWLGPVGRIVLICAIWAFEASVKLCVASAYLFLPPNLDVEADPLITVDGLGSLEN